MVGDRGTIAARWTGTGGPVVTRRGACSCVRACAGRVVGPVVESGGDSGRSAASSSLPETDAERSLCMLHQQKLLRRWRRRHEVERERHRRLDAAVEPDQHGHHDKSTVAWSGHEPAARRMARHHSDWCSRRVDILTSFSGRARDGGRCRGTRKNHRFLHRRNFSSPAALEGPTHLGMGVTRCFRRLPSTRCG